MEGYDGEEYELKCRECSLITYVTIVGNVLTKVKPAKYIPENQMGRVPGYYSKQKRVA